MLVCGEWKTAVGPATCNETEITCMLTHGVAALPTLIAHRTSPCAVRDADAERSESGPGRRPRQPGGDD